MGLPEWSEGLLEGPGGLPEGPEGLLEGPKGMPGESQHPTDSLRAKDTLGEKEPANKNSDLVQIGTASVRRNHFFIFFPLSSYRIIKKY